MRVPPSFRTLALFFLVVGCTDSSAPAVAPSDGPSRIVNGEPTGNRYPSVGALIIDWWEPIGVVNGDDQWCTGSLISATVFVTAAHCVTGARETPPGTQFYVSFASDLLAKRISIIEA